jgi:hypothetical protein
MSTIARYGVSAGRKSSRATATRLGLLSACHEEVGQVDIPEPGGARRRDPRTVVRTLR